MRRIPVFALSAAVLLSACGTTHSRRMGEVAPRPSATGSRAVTREMITKWNVLDAYEAVERSGGYKLASDNSGNVSMSQRRGKSSLTNRNADKPVLLIDGAMMLDYDMLRQIRAVQIERIDFLSPGDATQRFGTASSGAGAIIISTRGG